jgi:hypothetical protein
VEGNVHKILIERAGREGGEPHCFFGKNGAL